METKETIEQTIHFAQQLDVFSLQVSLAAPYPGTELYEQARLNGWFTKQDQTDLVETDGFQQSALAYPGLNKDEIFDPDTNVGATIATCVRNRSSASSKRCWKTRASTSAACAKATNFSNPWPSAAPIWQPPKPQPFDVASLIGVSS